MSLLDYTGGWPQSYPRKEERVTSTDTQAWIHRAAGMVAQFEAMDKGEVFSIDFTTILGSIPGTQTWIVQVDGSKTDRGEYWWDVTEFLAVTGPEEHPTVDDATDEQVAQVS